MKRWVGVALAPLAGSVTYVLVDKLQSHDSLLAVIPSESRLTLFAAMAGTTGALLGFAIAGITIIVTLSGGRRLAWLTQKEDYISQVQFLFTSATIGLALSTLTFLLLIVTGTDSHGPSVFWGAIFAAASVLVLERMARLVYFLHKLMPVAMKDHQEEGESASPNPAFKEPT